MKRDSETPYALSNSVPRITHNNSSTIWNYKNSASNDQNLTNTRPFFAQDKGGPCTDKNPILIFLPYYPLSRQGKYYYSDNSGTFLSFFTCNLLCFINRPDRNTLWAKCVTADFAIVTPALGSRKAGSLAGASLPPWKRGYFQAELFRNCFGGVDLWYFHQKKGCIFPGFQVQ